MTNWNFDMSAAPKGKTVSSAQRIGDKDVEVERFVSDLIIAAGSEGVVTVSKWIPKEERWNMFSKSAPPVAWMPWPSHPEALK